MRNELLYTVGGGPDGQIHFIASTNFSNVNFFQNITIINPNHDFSNLKVYINGELTNQTATSIFANADDDVIIRATDDHYPWFGNIFTDFNYIKSIEEPFPLMHQADGNPITSLIFYFSGCPSLTSIPIGLFDNNPQVTDFSSCFWTCSNLTSIPAGLFDNNTQATSFSNCFNECTGLTSIPEGLFDNNAQATDFVGCFYNCVSLTAIPQGLFDKNTQATNFAQCFDGCSDLVVNVQIGSIASSVNVTSFAKDTKEKGTVYCRAGSAAYNAFAESSDANVNVLTY